MNQINQQLIASKISDLASTTNEKALEKEVTRFFRRLRKEVLYALEEYWNDNSMFQGQMDLILAPIHTGLKEYYEIILARKVQEYQRGSKAAARIVKRITGNVAMKAAKPVTFTPTKDNLFGTLSQAENRLSDYTFTASESTMNRVDQNIKQILTDGYTEGVGINEVSNRISERFNQLESWEAQRIARTEIHNAQNIGIRDTYENLGVEYTMWSAAGDDRTRDSHVELDGEIIPMGGTYSNGLSYPGDTSGPIEEWINCRCANAPFVMPAGMMAPPGASQFREEDLIPIQLTEDNSPKDIEPVESVGNPPTVTPTQPYSINGGERHSSIKINQETWQKIIQHHTSRKSAKIEWGNCVDLNNGDLIYSKDIKGNKHGVTIQRPTTKSFGLLHNHPAEGGFSGADMYNQLSHRNQEVCIATTPRGVWIARDTEYGAFSKKQGIRDNAIYAIRSEMDNKVREFSNEVYERKYKERMLQATSRKEINAIKKELQADPEWQDQYNDWLLERFGVAKNRENYFEIEFIPTEELQYVKF